MLPKEEYMVSAFWLGGKWGREYSLRSQGTLMKPHLRGLSGPLIVVTPPSPLLGESLRS